MKCVVHYYSNSRKLILETFLFSFLPLSYSLNILLLLSFQPAIVNSLTSLQLNLLENNIDHYLPELRGGNTF